MAAGRNHTYLPLVEQRRRGELMLWIEDLTGNVDAVGTLNKQRDQPRAQTRFWPRKARTLISTASSRVKIDRGQKAPILSQVSHFYSDVGQYYIGANTYLRHRFVQPPRTGQVALSR